MKRKWSVVFLLGALVPMTIVAIAGSSAVVRALFTISAVLVALGGGAILSAKPATIERAPQFREDDNTDER